MKIKKIFYWIASFIGLILLLVISNPSVQSLRSKRPANEKVTIVRKNYYLFSTFTENGPDETDSYYYEYVGFLGMFLLITQWYPKTKKDPTSKLPGS